jgi:hypothetical protein
MNNPTGQLIQLSEFRQRRSPKEDKTIKIRLPEGALPSDSFVAVLMGNDGRWNIRKGDIILLLQTKDIRKGDAVATYDIEGECYFIGILDSDECYYYTEDDSFHRSKAYIAGRIIEVRRNGKLIQTTLPLRPLRESAKVYQFKRA